MCGCMSHVCVHVCICMCASWMFMCYCSLWTCVGMQMYLCVPQLPLTTETKNIYGRNLRAKMRLSGKHFKIGKRNRHRQRRILSHMSCTILAHVTAWFQVCMWPHFRDKISSYMNLPAQDDETSQVFPSLKHRNNSYLSHTEEKLI